MPTEAEETEAQGQTWLHSEFKAILSYTTLHEISVQNRSKTNEGAGCIPGWRREVES